MNKSKKLMFTFDDRNFETAEQLRARGINVDEIEVRDPKTRRVRLLLVPVIREPRTCP